MRQDWRQVVAAAVLAALLLVGPHDRPARVRGWAGTTLGRLLLGLGAVTVLVATLAVVGVASGSGHGETAVLATPAMETDDAGAGASLPEPTPTGGTPPAAPPGPTRPLVSVLKYTVQPGDTLRTIAEQFGVSVGALLAANQLADPDALAVGQALAIPLR